MLLGLGCKSVFSEFAAYVKSKYGADPAFNTMNLPLMVNCLLDVGIENPIVCSSINKIGYLMSPDIEEYETTLRGKPFRAMAMSILASGAINAEEAIQYVTGLSNINSIVFGASSKANIINTKQMIDQYWSN